MRQREMLLSTWVVCAASHPTPTPVIKLYGHELSGNSYKVRLLLELLKVPYEWVKVDLLKAEHKSPEYLTLNPFGQVPTLVDGDVIA